MKIKSLFISDIHLGNPNSQPKKLLEVFKKYDFENLFIVGDFIDLTYLKRRFYWNQNHTNIIQKVLKYSKKCKVVYILGNHDKYVRELIKDENIYIGNILICDEYVYPSKKGNIYITHGDCFDGKIQIHPFIYLLGDVSYEFSIKLNKLFNFFRKLFGMDYFSLSAYLKTKVKNIVKFLADYKKEASKKLSDKKCDIILMGHTHTPIMSEKYYNTGDFCESCSYIIEKLDGSFELRYMNKH